MVSTQPTKTEYWLLLLKQMMGQRVYDCRNLNGAYWKIYRQYIKCK